MRETVEAALIAVIRFSPAALTHTLALSQRRSVPQRKED
jgi:hypothetical protein